jgi:tetratricopeptide (TPR) repeat protein
MTKTSKHSPAPSTPARDESDQLGDLDAYVALLNDETRIGAAAARALVAAGVGARASLLNANPSWHRIGTFTTLLGYAREAFDSDASVAHDLTTFVVEHVAGMSMSSASPEFATLLRRLQGTAWKEHGNALFMLERLEDASAATDHAIAAFTGDPLLVLDLGGALVLKALVLRQQGQIAEALPLLDEGIRIFADHADVRGYVSALQVRAMIAIDEQDLARARDLYFAAYDEAERSGNERECARILHNVALCAFRMGDLDLASDYLSRAFVGFARERMDGELQRSIWLTASVARERGDLDDALRALHMVYARFLERGMVTDAARVLVELGDVVAKMTGDLGRAKDMCAKLAVTLGRYDVPANVRAAVEYLKDASASTTSIATLRDILRRVRAFLCDVLVSSSAVFNPTLPG